MGKAPKINQITYFRNVCTCTCPQNPRKDYYIPPRRSNGAFYDHHAKGFLGKHEPCGHGGHHVEEFKQRVKQQEKYLSQLTFWPKNKKRSDEAVARARAALGDAGMALEASGSGGSTGSTAMPGASDATRDPKDFTYNLYQNLTPMEESKLMLEAAIIMKELILQDKEKLAQRVHIGSGLRFKIEGDEEARERLEGIKFDGAVEVAERMKGLNLMA